MPRHLLLRVRVDLPARQFPISVEVARGLENGFYERILAGERFVARPRDRVFQFFPIYPPGACAKSNFRRSRAASRGGVVVVAPSARR